MSSRIWPASRLIPMVLMAVLYTSALGSAMKMLAGMNVGVAILTTVLIAGGMLGALKIVAGKAVAAGHRPKDTGERSISSLGIACILMFIIAVMALGILGLTAWAFALALTGVFGMLGAGLLILIFVRIENGTRDALAERQAA